MPKLTDFVQLQIRVGAPVRVGAVTLTPRSQALTVRWPNGGFVWNRPVGVQVEQDGLTRDIPILDVTRVAQFGLLALGFMFFAFRVVRAIRTRSDENVREL